MLRWTSIAYVQTFKSKLEGRRENWPNDSSQIVVNVFRSVSRLLVEMFRALSVGVSDLVFI